MKLTTKRAAAYLLGVATIVAANILLKRGVIDGGTATLLSTSGGTLLGALMPQLLGKRPAP